MRLLLDTHALIWAMEESPALSPGAAAAILETEVVCVSIASFWEIAVKLSIGKLRLPETWLEDLNARISNRTFELLAVVPAHCGRVATLPMHHRDPFDRMLIAQALEEGLGIVSADPALDAYGVERIW